MTEAQRCPTVDLAARLQRELWALAHADAAYDPADVLLFSRMAEDMEVVAEAVRAALGQG